MELEAQIGRMKRTMLEDSARASERLATMNASKEMCQGQIRQASSMSRDVHSCTHWLRLRDSPLPPAYELVLRGRYWSAKINDISL